MGTFDYVNATYPTINRANIDHGLQVLQMIIDRYKHHPAVMGIEPVNEPWEHTPIEELKSYYWEGYLKVKRDAPYWRYVMHDSFRANVETWGGFMDGCPDRVLDMHIYQAWSDPVSRIAHYNDACAQKHTIAQLEKEFGPVIVGEWSLATDNWYVKKTEQNSHTSIYVPSVGMPSISCVCVCACRTCTIIYIIIIISSFYIIITYFVAVFPFFRSTVSLYGIHSPFSTSISFFYKIMHHAKIFSAMWLNGFNDNLAGFPRLPCKNIPCSDPYFGNNVIPNAPVGKFLLCSVPVFCLRCRGTVSIPINRFILVLF